MDYIDPILAIPMFAVLALVALYVCYINPPE